MAASEETAKGYFIYLRLTYTMPKFDDIFFSVDGLGNGKWGVRNFILSDSINPTTNEDAAGPTQRRLTDYSRIIRDTALVNELKKLVNYKCQLCELSFPLPQGKSYIEGHHIKPLGKPYDGPDIKENILIVCPNCHVKCDYKLIELTLEMIKNNKQNISPEYINFHNNEYSVTVQSKQ
jgi:predicted restriction endonuclease